MFGGTASSRQAHSRRLCLRARVFLVLVLVLLCFTMCVAGSARPAESSTQEKAQQRRRQQQFVGYAQRVSAAMGNLLNVNPANIEDNDGSSFQSHMESDATAAERQRRADLGLDLTSVSGSPLQWAASLQGILRETTIKTARTVSAVVQLAQVALGAPLPATSANDAAVAAEESSALKQNTTSAQKARAQRLRMGAQRGHQKQAAFSAGATSGAPRVLSSSRSTNTVLRAVANGRSYSCAGGVQAFTEDSTWQCANGTTVDALSCLANLESCAESCEWATGNVTCICARDAVLYSASTTVLCFERALDLQPELPAAQLCQDELSGSLGLARTSPGEYCLSARRKDVLNMSVTWRLKLLTDSDIAAIKSVGDTIVYPGFNTSQKIWTVNTGNGTVVVDSYEALSTSKDLFSYVLQPANLTDFAITTTHTAVRSAKAFTAVYSFAAPEVMTDTMWESALSTPDVAAAYLTTADGVSEHQVVIDLAAVPDACVEGNQLYVETGVGGHGVYLNYRVARIHVALSDLDDPPVRHKYPKKFNVLYAFLIALIGAIVVGVGLAVLWYCCQRQVEPDDDLVAKAQRNRTRREEIEQGKVEKNKRRRGVGGGREGDVSASR